jgi:hypothetical protein
MRSVDPIQYFQDCMLEESLVIRLSFQPHLEKVELVVDYAADIVIGKFGAQQEDRPRPLRDFRKIDFGAITSMNWNGLRWNAHAYTGTKYQLDLTCGQMVITEAVCTPQEADYQMKIGLGRFGVYVFSFSIMSADRKLARATQIAPGVWEYSDAQTDVVLKFANPFSDEET